MNAHTRRVAAQARFVKPAGVESALGEMMVALRSDGISALMSVNDAYGADDPTGVRTRMAIKEVIVLKVRIEKFLRAVEGVNLDPFAS